MKKMKNDYVNLVVIYKVSDDRKEVSTLMEYSIRTDFEFTKDGKRI